MDSLIKKTFSTPYGEKTISVHVTDISLLDEPVDIMTVSAYYRSYGPTPGTLMRALYDKGISVRELSASPEMDLRNTSDIWLSRRIENPVLPIGRIGCIESSRYDGRQSIREREARLISCIRAYFCMLNIAALSGVKCETVSIPVIGGGSQRISSELITTPVINECVKLLKSSEYIKRIMIITRNQSQAFGFAMALEKSYSLLAEDVRAPGAGTVKAGNARAFISYSSKDKNIADNLCSKLESNGIRVWYAPRDIFSNDYASSIVNAISSCSHFIVILSKNSLQSNHVLNEIDLAFKEISRNISFHPLKVDEEELGPAFLYYLSRQHWMDAHVPPLEKRLDEFVSKIAGGKTEWKI